MINQRKPWHLLTAGWPMKSFKNVDRRCWVFWNADCFHCSNNLSLRIDKLSTDNLPKPFEWFL